MKRPIDIGVELLELHNRYITENKKPQYDFPPGERDLNRDEIYEIDRAVTQAPRIGRIGTSRKRQDELIAIPRGLAEWLMRQLSGIEASSTLWKKSTIRSVISGEMIIRIKRSCPVAVFC